MNLTAIGEERFRILSISDDMQPYRVGQIESVPLEDPQRLDLHKRVRLFRAEVMSYLDLLSLVMADGLDLSGLELPEDPMTVLYLAASLLQVPPKEKQPALEAENAIGLLEQLVRLYRREIALLRIDAIEDHNVQGEWLN